MIGDPGESGRPGNKVSVIYLSRFEANDKEIDNAIKTYLAALSMLHK